ncbi:MAG: phosphate ABC transporter substrate-binding protein [Rhodospirillaceae bacterium]|jgi:ABC-type phosphate/phosphonate transport system substrate-binding protein|nr:phosphate ABC transporter substrate-binding protein [Rhodospirillaceae bacterium]
MLASLPMYALDVVRAANEAWWQGLARHLRAAGLAEVPMGLTWPAEREAHWRRSDLMFSQTCGYPLTHALAGAVRLVATPCYAAEGCEGPHYDSVVVVAEAAAYTRPADLAGRCCAVNAWDSQSGCNALADLVAPQGGSGSADGRFFAEVLKSGSHAASLALVASGRADVAAIDCVVFALLARHAPDRLQGLRTLCRTRPAPGLPYITAAATSDEDVERLRQGLRAAIADPALVDGV